MAKPHNGMAIEFMLNTDQGRLNKSKIFHTLSIAFRPNSEFIDISMKRLNYINIIWQKTVFSVLTEDMPFQKSPFLSTPDAHSRNMITLHVVFWSEPGCDDTA